MEHRPALDGVRGVAVLAVVIYHFAPSALPAGFLGVDLFFVLSGLLITSLLLREHRATGRIDLPAFWGRRIRRLLPAALLALLVIIVLSVRSGSVGIGLPGDLLATLGYANNWHQIAASQSYFAAFGPPSPTKHFWSLAIEEQFYLVWPLLVAAGLALIARRARRDQSERRLSGTPVATGVLVAGIATSAALMAWYHATADDPSRAYYGTDSRAFELLIGALLAVAVRRGMVRPRRGLVVAGVVAALACGAAMFVWSDGTAFYYEGGALLWSIGAAVLLLALLPSTGLSRAFAVHPLRWLGLISYGVYLFHFPIGVWLDTSTSLEGPTLFAAKVALTLAIATASYFLLELPVRRRRLPRPGLVAKLAAPIAIGVTAVLVVAFVAPLTPAAEVEVAAEPSSDANTDFVISRGSPDGETAAAPLESVAPPTTSAQDGILAMAAFDQRRKQAVAIASMWTPPPQPPLLGKGLAQNQADVSLVGGCAAHYPLVEYRDNGTGRLVAVIGDSMTVQMRDTILRDRQYDWFLLARCGTALIQFDHDDAPGRVGLAEAFAKLLYMRPQALIIALGITDVTHHLDYDSSLQWFVDTTRDVPCRSFVNLAPIDPMDRYEPGATAAFAAFDQKLVTATDGTDVRVLDWAGRVAAMPQTGLGYHPWLNPKDWVHLIPGQGFDQRLQLMESGLAGCF
jgi:peptidoglycan/LPS O-acetylase OafA/YrhL